MTSDLTFTVTIPADTIERAAADIGKHYFRAPQYTHERVAAHYAAEWDWRKDAGLNTQSPEPTDDK